jgi:hypothetical protein
MRRRATMSEKTLEEARERKAEIEKQIRVLLRKYSVTYGIPVESIYLHIVHSFGDIPTVYDVEIEARL